MCIFCASDVTRRKIKTAQRDSPITPKTRRYAIISCLLALAWCQGPSSSFFFAVRVQCAFVSSGAHLLARAHKQLGTKFFFLAQTNFFSPFRGCVGVFDVHKSAKKANPRRVDKRLRRFST